MHSFKAVFKYMCQAWPSLFSPVLYMGAVVLKLLVRLLSKQLPKSNISHVAIGDLTVH